MASSSSSSSTMNVIIGTEDENSFSLGIGQNDTVCANKARICKTTGTPVFHQILVFNGRTLDNSFHIHTYEITPNSSLFLCIQDPLADLGRFPAPPSKPSFCSTWPNTLNPFSISPSTSAKLFCNSNKKCFNIAKVNFFSFHLVYWLPPPDRLGVYIHEKRHELQDAKCLSDYGISSGSMLNVFIKPSLVSLPSPTPPPKKGNIQVLTACGKLLCLQVKFKRKVWVRLCKCSSFLTTLHSISDMILSFRKDYDKLSFWKHVKVLRTELARLQQLEKFELSLDYFFIHNYKVLNEAVSFRENCIEKDDEIEIVHGSVHLLLEQLSTSDDLHLHTCRFLPLLQA
ncbi:hypothetical protein Cgig2_019542 [Carnegiea gigantea]|uniref:Ubiquitin-like domain-containing protein n=1 Tax=Carnegiea gigantea TaxID=171969 RepID=A0A9Q1KGA0_9CARY|nr:hypothetical protein Cgig2_019542 [Carnegiea gigantea]